MGETGGNRAGGRRDDEAVRNGKGVGALGRIEYVGSIQGNKEEKARIPGRTRSEEKQNCVQQK